MLVSLQSMLDDAVRGGYAIGSFNVFDMETTLGVLDALRERRSPGVIAVTRRHIPFLDLEGLAAFIRHGAGESDVPIALHLDHASDVGLIVRALEAGFTSVMFDGSALPPEERMAETRRVVQLAHAAGASAEAELEHMGRLGVETGGGPTDPAVAGAFARRTALDVLAVSVGNIHGAIAAPVRLDLKLLAELRSRVPCHLSLHGGSGIPEGQLIEAIHGGVSKVSFFHGLAEVALQRLQQAAQTTPPGELAALIAELRIGFRDQCARLVEVLGSDGRAASDSGRRS